VHTNVKSREPAYSGALSQNKIDWSSKIQRVRQAGSQTDSQTAMMDGLPRIDENYTNLGWKV